MKYVLGPAIVSSQDVRSADISAPTGSVGWQVFVSLSAVGQQRWTDYTAKHNENAHPGDPTNVVAFLVDGRIHEAATIQSIINGATSIGGDYEKRAATLLAANLTGGVLPAPFQVVSVSSR